MPRSAIAILSKDDDKVGGMGFLIDDRRIITCSHVLYDCGWISASQSSVNDTRVSVELLPSEAGHAVSATIEFLVRVQNSEESIDDTYDIAVLVLAAPLATSPLRNSCAIRSNLNAVEVRVFGLPERQQRAGSWARGITEGHDRHGRVFIKVNEVSPGIDPGFSGAPVLDKESADILGMIVSRQRDGRAFMLPMALIESRLQAIQPAFPLTPALDSEKDYPHLSKLRTFALAQIKKFIHAQSVPIEAALVEEYAVIAAVHQGSRVDAQRLSPSAFLRQHATVNTYLQAPGGSGKSIFLMQLLLSAIQGGQIAFYLDTRNAGELPDDPQAAIEPLFARCAVAAGTYARYNNAKEDVRYDTIIIVDGLNESLGSARTVRRIVEYIVRDALKVTVYAADRMSGSSALPEGFKRGTILPLDFNAIETGSVRSLLQGLTSAKFRRLLTVPFFFDLYMDLRSGDLRAQGVRHVGDRTGLLRAYFIKYLRSEEGLLESERIADQAIKALAPVAFSAYSRKDEGLRIKPNHVKDALEAQSGPPLWRFLDAGILVEDNGAYGFRHQLIHDYLVAEYLSSDSSRWRDEEFTDASFGMTSFEALELTSEILATRADEFIIQVHDWNYSAALDCVLNLEAGVSGRESPVSEGLKIALLAMRAEKRFDHFAHTRKGAQEKCEQIWTTFRLGYVHARTLAELRQLVRYDFEKLNSVNLAPVLRRWCELFTSVDAPVPSHWPLLQDSPLLAWTAANVFRRHVHGDRHGVVGYLCALYKALREGAERNPGSGVLRWRIVHVLGTGAHEEVGAILGVVVEDTAENGWVRYGAVRSLVEVASRSDSPATAHSLLEPLLRALPGLRGIDAFREARNVAILRGTSKWWSGVYGAVLERGVAILSSEIRALSSEGTQAHDSLTIELTAWRGRLALLQEQPAEDVSGSALDELKAGGEQIG